MITSVPKELNKARLTVQFSPLAIFQSDLGPGNNATNNKGGGGA